MEGDDKVEKLRELLARKLRSAVSEFSHVAKYKKSDSQQLTFRGEKGTTRLADRASELLFRFYGIVKNPALEHFVCEDLINFVAYYKEIPIGKVGAMFAKDGNVFLSIKHPLNIVNG